MPTTHNIRQLKINKLTDAQYEQAVKSADELYLTPDTGEGGSGTVTSVRVQAGTGLTSSQSTAQTETLNTTISIANGYKLPTTTEWSNKQDALPSQSGNSGKFLTTNGTTMSWATVSGGGSAEVVNVSGNSVTLNLQANKIYNLTGDNIERIMISSCEASFQEIIIFFTAGDYFGSFADNSGLLIDPNSIMADLTIFPQGVAGMDIIIRILNKRATGQSYIPQG